MAILVQDSFTDIDGTSLASHSPDIGGAWVSVTGSSSIFSNRCDSNSTLALYYNQFGGSHQLTDASVKIDNYTTAFAEPFRLLLRLQDANNFYAWTPGYGIWKRVGGVGNDLLLFVDGTDGLPVELQMIGNTLYAYHNSILVGQVTDPSPTFSTGFVGFSQRTSSSWIDDITISSIVSPPADPTALTATCTVDNPPSSDFSIDIDTSYFTKIEGLVNVINGSASVTGFGTKFTTDLIAGDLIVLNGVVYEVLNITDDTNLTLTTTYTGTSQERIPAWKTEEITFTNTVTGDANSYFWDFGDGNTSTDENPTHIYTSPGNYEVKLTVFALPELTGTVSVVSQSNALTGVGTAFTTELAIGDYIVINGVTYEIQSITDNTNAVLTEVYFGTTESGITALHETSKTTGTIQVTQNSTTINGTASAFLTDYSIGDVIVIKGVSYVIDTITSDTVMDLVNEYTGTNDTGIDGFKKQSKYAGAYGESTFTQTIYVNESSSVSVNTIKGDFDISLSVPTVITGTISVVNGSPTIEGVGTSFTTELEAGEQVLIEGVIYTILSITDNDTLTLTENYAAANDSGLTSYQVSNKLTGTIAVTQNSKIVTGTSTAFLTDFVIGDSIVIEGVSYLVDSITNDTELILNIDYAGTNDTGLDVFKKSSSYSSSNIGPVLIDFVDNSIGTITEYLWDFGDGALATQTGTISVTQGSKIVTGSGTLFTSELAVGDRIEINGLLYTIESIESDTSLTLASVYGGLDASGLSVELKQAGTTSTEANPDFVYTDPGIYTITLEVVKDNVVHKIERTIQVKTDSSTPENTMSSFEVSEGRGDTKLSGTLSAKKGSRTITGSNTFFTTELEAGGEITIQGITYTIESISSDTELTITQDYIGGDTATIEVQGDISVNQDSKTVTGIGSLFTEDLEAGQTINIEGVGYVIESITSDTELELTYDYIGTTATGLTITETVGVLAQGLTGFSSYTGAEILTGTLSVANGKLKVTGSGTTFTTELVNGDSITIAGTTYKVLGVVSDTELIISKVYEGATASGITTIKSAKESPYSESLQFNNSSSEVFEDLTGTINVTNNDATVIGVATSFTTELESGQTIRIEGIEYIVDTITSDTELELTIVYAGSTDTGLTGEEQLINTYFWEFGDGTFSTEENPEHIYSESGSFEATLTVTNDNGSTRFTTNVTSLKIDFFSIDHRNHRINMFSLEEINQPKKLRSSGSFGNAKGQFNNPQDLFIVGVGKKRLDGVEV
jgi:PKD repeat protein